MSAKHYSVRRCVDNYPNWKVVLAGGWFGYSDTDTGIFQTFDAALKVANDLNRSKGFSTPQSGNG